MKRILILTILIVTLPLLAEAQLKVGVMNPEAVLGQLPETEQVQRDLDSFIQQRREEFSQQYQNWMESVSEFEEQVENGTLTGEQRQQREQELGEREEEISAMQQRLQTQIQNRQNELLSPIMQRVENAMEAVAQELDLDYVLNRITSRGDPVVYYASERGVDITEQVIERLKEN